MSRLADFARAYWPLASRLLSIVASWLSAIGLVAALQTDAVWTTMSKVLVGSFAVFAFITVWLEAKSARRRHAFTRDREQGIRDYMYRWISQGGRVAVWTRDHSWVRDDNMRELLERKAKSKELILCLPQATKFSNALQSLGADVYTYGSGAGVPAARFTIVHFERDGSAVAVGRPNSDCHVIEEFQPGDVAFYLAEDLVKLAKIAGPKER